MLLKAWKSDPLNFFFFLYGLNLCTYESEACFSFSLLVSFLSKASKNQSFPRRFLKLFLKLRKIGKIIPQKLFWQITLKQNKSCSFSFLFQLYEEYLSKNVDLSSIASATCGRAGNKTQFSSACPVLYWENYSFSPYSSSFVIVHISVSKIKDMSWTEKTWLKIRIDCDLRVLLCLCSESEKAPVKMSTYQENKDPFPTCFGVLDIFRAKFQILLHLWKW